jgi:hypothetical protein
MKQFFTIILISFVFLSSVPQKAHAGAEALAIKEYVLDMWAWFLGGQLQGALVRETTTWVNEGFGAVARTIERNADGEPFIADVSIPGGDATFIVNPQIFFKNISSSSAATFFEQLSEASSDPSQALNTIFPGFRDDLLREIASETQGMTGNFFDDFESDLTEPELEAYLNDFTSGGWEMFLRTTQVCANNYSCSRIAVLNELNSRVSQAQDETRTDLEQSGGFLTIRKCVEPSATDPSGCAGYEEVTPGQLIGEQINKATEVEFERYSDTDEVTELLIVLLEQLLNGIIDVGLSSMAGLFAERDLEGQYEELGNQVDELVEEGKEELERIEEEEEEGEVARSCVVVSDGSVCTTSTDVDMRADFSGASHQFDVVYLGSETFYSEIEYDFGEFNDNVTVVTDSPNGNDTGILENGDTVEVFVRVDDLDLIEDFNDFEGTISIGDLDIRIRGVDRRE